MAENLSLWDRLRKRLNFNRLDRMVQHYSAIKEQLAPKGANEKEEVEFFTREFERYAKITLRLSNIRWGFWVLLYAALLINVLQAIPFLRFLVAFVELGSAIFGTTLLFIIVFLLSIKIRLNLEIMQDCLTHLIAFYYKNPKRQTKLTLERIAKVI